MTNKIKAIIPARAGSKRFPKKNQLLWDYTADFIEESKLFSDVYVTTDSPELNDRATTLGYNTVKRPACLTKDETSIRPVIQDLVAQCDLYDDYLCLLYLTTPERDRNQFYNAIAMLERYDSDQIFSLMSFFEPRETPYLARYKHGMDQVIKHDLGRHQDYEPIVNMCHHICIFHGSVLHELNNQLYSEILTKPVFLNFVPVDIDTEDQYTAWLSTKS